MKLGLICVGRLKAGPERELFARYAERIRALRRLGLEGLELKEIDESKAAGAERASREAMELLAALPAESRLAAFDERGRAETSAAFAQFIASERDRGCKALWFAIGGAEGLDESVRARATAVFSFGAMTLPHQLARILAAEQIYRAMTILSGHPYHRQ
ncbi:23S rRNA (pseudouridine(1915)-N(3))-methyltransferase RlmH [Methylocystis sp. H4A]|uniref:23S rRNA (pseudouridine(1915)-N(3))-methyltransferase RlmH n=1 Tax=Methylocystis sp. H4A TaxID=2785788 RepID=UPI0018C2E061|nr:23S rRNA (pseudouridine(1915)-N(3))-methyltransferase RlmH [Methylocystis sp. H4A]MBG0803925.1 23S rRNA (pseudouridine(1915)-N(3))-methyltransferase RlmH [Methylocystis sp. H4A]